jgi:hypothetical protein
MPRFSPAVLATFVAAALLAGAPSAGASASALSELKHSCPADYRAEGIQASFEPSRVNEALNGHFDLGHNFTPTLHPGTSWLKDPYHSANYRHRLYDLSWLDVLIWAYKDPKNRYSDSTQTGALNQARKLAWSFVRADRKGKVDKKTAWLDHVAARRAEYLAYIARVSACQGALSSSDAGAFLKELRRHDSFLRNVHSHIANHRLSVQMALAILGHQLPKERNFARAGREATTKFHKAFHQGFDEDSGVWLENSPGYFDYAIRLVDTWLGAVDPNDKDLLDARDKMQVALAWLTAPSGNEAQLGDTLLLPPQPEVGALASVQEGMWVAQRAGYVVVKDPRTGGYLVISSSFHTWHHKHADELGFELYDRFHRVVADTGKYDNTIPLYNRFETSARAHSTMTIDGQDFLWFWNQHKDKPKPYGSGIEATGQGNGWYGVLATNPLTQRQGVNHDRLFLYKPGVALIVYDMVHSDQRHSYTRYFQLGPDVTTTKVGPAALALSGAGSAGALTDWTDAQTAAADIVRGQKNPLAGWTYPAFRTAEPRDTVSWTSEGTDLNAAAAFSLAGHAAAVTNVSTPAGTLGSITLADATQVTVTRNNNSLQISAGG